MSIHIHKLIEAGNNQEIGLSDMSEVEGQRSLGEVYQFIKSAVCFDIGEASIVKKIKLNPELFILPFDVCYFEYTAPIEDVGTALVSVLSSNVDESTINSYLFFSIDEKWFFMMKIIMERIELHGDKFIILRPIPRITRDKALNDEFANSYMEVIGSFLSALNCTNINRVEHTPPEKLQRSRKKKGKQPLFSYWTLEIDPQKSRADGHDYFGTHSSPRVHLRRGHPRQYAPGLWTWVKAHAVGDKSLGIIHKDYKLKQPETVLE